MRRSSAAWRSAQVNGGFRNLVDKPVLALDGVARGPLADMLRFVNATPVGQWTGAALARRKRHRQRRAQARPGAAAARRGREHGQGSPLAPGNDVRITPDTPLMAGARRASSSRTRA